MWDRFGQTVNYVEPFAGNLAVLLSRPGGAGKNEPVNDRDCYLANFWRALQADPEQTSARDRARQLDPLACRLSSKANLLEN